MKRLSKLAVALGLGLSATVATAGAAYASTPTDITDAHVDIVEVECTVVDSVASYEVQTHVDPAVGAPFEIAPGDIDDYVFAYDKSNITWDDPVWIATDEDTDIPNIGFNYHVPEDEEDAELCHEEVEVEIGLLGGSDGDVSFFAEDPLNGFTSTDSGIGGRVVLGNEVTGTPEDHAHGLWEYAGGDSDGGAWNVTFTAYAGGTSNPLDQAVTPVSIVIQ